MKTFKTSILLAVVFLFSIASYAGNAPQNKSKKNKQVTEVTVADFSKQAPELVDKNVVITGKVKKIHKKNNKGLSLGCDNTKKTLNVYAGKGVDNFSNDLVGKKVKITGKVFVKVIDENTIKEAEAKGKTKQAENYRNRLEKAGKDKIEVYSIRASNVEVVE